MTSKIPFYLTYQNHSRNVVVHHTHILNDFILKYIKKSDIVFFDDCVYSQYIFYLKNFKFFEDNNIPAVFSFSTNIYRKSTIDPIIDITAKLHDNYHLYSDKSGFMSLNELKQILKFKNCYLACHGHNHLKIKNSIKSISAFKEDLLQSIEFLNLNQFSTNIFVYPYDNNIRFSEKLLKDYQFNFIYPTQKNSRIYIEDIVNASN